MLPDRVHLIDGGSGSEQQIRDPLFFGETYVEDGSGPQRRATTRNEAEEQVFGV